MVFFIFYCSRKLFFSYIKELVEENRGKGLNLVVKDLSESYDLVHLKITIIPQEQQ